MTRTVLITSSEFPPGPGGIGAHAAALATGLSRSGWRVVVNSPQDNADDDAVMSFNERLESSGVHVDRLRRGRSRLWSVCVGRLARLQRLLRRWQPDAVIASGRAPSILCAMMRRLTRRRLIAVVHGSEIGTGKRRIDRLTQRAIARADHVVAVSRFTANRMASTGMTARSLSIIPNGADPAAFEPVDTDALRAIRDRHGVGDNPLIVTLGQLGERKAQDVVIRALPTVAAEIPMVRYVAVGLPTHRARLLALADELGVRERVVLPGAASNTDRNAWLQAADVFALTSRTTASGDCEGYGIAAVEAALCGCPAVVTSGSGLAEAVHDGVTGLVVPPDDPPATAQALICLLTDATLRREMGRAAQDRARNEQLWSHRIAEWHRILERLIAAVDR